MRRPWQADRYFLLVVTVNHVINCQVSGSFGCQAFKPTEILWVKVILCVGVAQKL